MVTKKAVGKFIKKYKNSQKEKQKIFFSLRSQEKIQVKKRKLWGKKEVSAKDLEKLLEIILFENKIISLTLKYKNRHYFDSLVIYLKNGNKEGFKLKNESLFGIKHLDLLKLFNLIDELDKVSLINNAAIAYLKTILTIVYGEEEHNINYREVLLKLIEIYKSSKNGKAVSEIKEEISFFKIIGSQFLEETSKIKDDRFMAVVGSIVITFYTFIIEWFAGKETAEVGNDYYLPGALLASIIIFTGLWAIKEGLLPEVNLNTGVEGYNNIRNDTTNVHQLFDNYLSELVSLHTFVYKNYVN